MRLKKSRKYKGMKEFGMIDDQSNLQQRKKYPIKFNLIVFCNYVYIFSLCGFLFNQAMLIKKTLNQNQKEEGRSKA